MKLPESETPPFCTDDSFWIWSTEGSHARADDRSPSHYEVRRFRRCIHLSRAAVEAARVHVSADSRYILFCNGERVGRGPGKGDVTHHFYETYDLTEWLEPGENVIAALVMDYSHVATRPDALGPPTSIMTYAGGFILEGGIEMDDGTSVSLSTDEAWQVSVDRAYRFQNDNTTYEGFIGYFEDVDLSRIPVGWTRSDFDDTGWGAAHKLYAGESIEARRDPKSPYGLMPRMIPGLEEGPVKLFEAVFLAGGGEPDEGWGALISGGNGVSIPADTEVEVIFDTGRLTTSYPCLEVSGGKGAQLSLQYAEALRLSWGTPGAELLGRRQSLSNLASGFADETTAWTFDRRGVMTGWHDIYRLAGGEDTFEPFHWRTFRYVGLKVRTGSEPLSINSMGHRFTAYPFRPVATFRSSEPEHTAFWDKSIWTMRLCSHETFEDGPYYEQMQYAGDTRITGMISMLTSGDSRLSRQALLHFDWSRLPTGITHSRYPSRFMQAIPSWSLHWISFACDYLKITGDAGTVRSILPGIRAVIDWFRRHVGPGGLPEGMPYWNSVDWCPEWQRGQPPGWDEGPTCVISCQYLHGLRELAWLERRLGQGGAQVALDGECEQVVGAIRGLFWNDAEGLFRDRPGGAELSQVGNAWAVICGAATESDRARMTARFPFDKKLAPASFFGLHYVFRANEIMGNYEMHFARLLEPWSFMNRFGLDAWAEETSFWRSLCHAWSAHPVLEFLRVILGVDPVENGFEVVNLTPLPCGLDHAEGSVVTPKGPIAVSWTMREGSMQYSASLPENVVGRLLLPGMATRLEVTGEVKVSGDPGSSGHQHA